MEMEMHQLYEGFSVRFPKLSWISYVYVKRKLLYINEYCEFSSLRSKFIIGVAAVEVTDNLTQILDFRQSLSSLSIR